MTACRFTNAGGPLATCLQQIKTLREQENARYREELKAARKKRAAANGAKTDEKAP